MTNVIRDNTWLWAVKITAAAFQVPATWHVFNRIFEQSGRGRYERYITSFLAILLIDVFFLAVLYLLESPELTPLQKLPWVLVGVGLLIAVIAIGFADEGVMAWAPRMGFIGLVLADLFGWVVEALTTYFSRDAKEKRIRDKQVLARRNLMYAAWERAMQEIAPDLIDVQVARETRLLGLEEPALLPAPREYPVEVEDNIFQLSPTEFAWQSPHTSEYHDTTTQGKPYSLPGARRALARHLKDITW